MIVIKVDYPVSQPIIKVTYDDTNVYVSTKVEATYIKVDYGNGDNTGAVWGYITGTLSDQTDLQTALDGKFDDPTGTTLQYIRGDGSLATFPTTLEAEDVIIEVRNNTGSTIPKGTVVYINGALGNRPTVAYAIATTDGTSAQTLGLTQAAIPNNTQGYVVIIGRCTDLNTSAFSEGTQLYLSGTVAGGYTNVKPYAPIHLVYIGIVTRSHPTQGTIDVKVQNGYEIEELHDVAALNPNNGDVLQYVTSTGLWTKTSSIDFGSW